MESVYHAEMSEWFKEHDWKSCVGLKPTGGSNPLLCANKTHPCGCVFSLLQKRNKESVREVQSLARVNFYKRKPPDLGGFVLIGFVAVASDAVGQETRIRAFYAGELR